MSEQPASTHGTSSQLQKMEEHSHAQQQQTTPVFSRLKDFEQTIRTTMQDDKVPGAAVILIKNGEVLMAQGFGKRNVAQNLDVTPRTLFPIGSSGKAFTAAAVAMLVEGGKLEWDKPIRAYLPTFKLHDQFATERMTPRDLLTHRSGLPRHEFLWYGSEFTRKDVVERLAHLEPNADFRTTYQYNNLMFVTAGYLIEHVTGQSWETFVTERILKPLGMHSTTLSPRDSQRTDDYAMPYAEKKDEVEEIPFYDKWQIIAPAGGINTNLEDIQHWLLFHLHEGKHGETQLLASQQLAQNHTPHTPIPPDGTIPMGKNPELANWCYGMGWFIGSYKGHRIVQHGGSIDGFMAEVALLPDDNAAVAVFTNKGGTLVPYIIAFSACDLLLGTDATDWNGRFMALIARTKEEQEKLLAETNATETIAGTRPSHALDAYCGEYEHPGYGTITITHSDGQLQFTYNAISSSLTHIHYDIFEVFIERFQFKAKVSFVIGEKGAIESLAVKLETAVKAQVFMHVPEKQTTE